MRWLASAPAAVAVSVLTASALAGPADYSTAVRPDPEGEPTAVRVRFVFNDISRVDDVAQTFDADVFVAASWKDARLASDAPQLLRLDEVWHPRFLVVNARASTRRLPEEVRVAPDGTVEYVQRLIGAFSVPLDLRRFPNDVQTLTIRLVSYRYGPDAVELRVKEEVPARPFSVAGWWMASPGASSAVFRIEPTGAEFVEARATVEGRRVAEYYRYTMQLPLLLIVTMAWTVFWIDPSLLPSQIAVSTASVFTLIAFRFSLRLVLPPTSYMTSADKLVLGCTLLVFCVLGHAIGTGRLARSGREGLAREMDRFGRWIYLLGVILVWVLSGQS